MNSYITIWFVSLMSSMAVSSEDRPFFATLVFATLVGYVKLLNDPAVGRICENIAQNVVRAVMSGKIKLTTIMNFLVKSVKQKWHQSEWEELLKRCKNETEVDDRLNLSDLEEGIKFDDLSLDEINFIAHNFNISSDTLARYLMEREDKRLNLVQPTKMVPKTQSSVKKEDIELTNLDPKSPITHVILSNSQKNKLDNLMKDKCRQILEREFEIISPLILAAVTPSPSQESLTNINPDAGSNPPPLEI